MVRLDKEQQEWMNKKIKEGEFNSVSSAIRRCVIVAQRVYENGTVDEQVKFILNKG